METNTVGKTGSVRDRAHGALLGLAIGDALGTTLEFSERDEHPKLTEMVGGGPFNLPPGVWTDDTSMALCLADSLLHAGKLDEHDLMRRFVWWWRKGLNSPMGRCFDIGNTTRGALSRFEASGDPLNGDTSTFGAGNGSLMRLAPVVLFNLNDMAAIRDASRRQSTPTHASEACLDACEWFGELLGQAISGTPKAELLAPRATNFVQAVSTIAAGSWAGKSRKEIASSGYVIHTLEAAIWAVSNANSFEEALVLAVNLGEDADTVGAVTGQLAGAIWGASQIPPRWLDVLRWRTRIEDTANALLLAGAESRGLPGLLLDRAPAGAPASWESLVALGQWAEIPEGLTYDQSGRLAHLLDGYAAADHLGLGYGIQVGRRLVDQFFETSRWTGSAIELWITLFVQHRADHFTVWFGAASPRPDLDGLCRALRGALLEGRLWPRLPDRAAPT